MRRMIRGLVIVLVAVGMLAVSAPAAPSHFIRDCEINFQSEEIQSLRPVGRTAWRATATITFTGETPEGATCTGHGTWRFQARCVTAECGALAGKGLLRFEAFNDSDPGMTLRSNGVLRGLFIPEIDDEVLIGFSGQGRLRIHVNPTG